MVILDDSKADQCKLFAKPFDVVQAHNEDQVQPALARMQQCVEHGLHLAGYFSYELGYVLEPSLASMLPPLRKVPLLWFGVFATPPIEMNGEALSVMLGETSSFAGLLRHEWDPIAYSERFDRIHKWIIEGDIYQANLSMRSEFAFVGDARGLYREMRQHARSPNCAYVDDGVRQILSFSPELFFDLSAQRSIQSKPMKGTASRESSAQEDEAAREALRGSIKNRSENLMIVDLIRNDLGRVAETGSVRVDDLFSIETYPTVHQMVSTVSARMRSGVSIEELLRAIFPCGSITGTPKVRAMEIIRGLESSPRGVYCGAIGHFAPDRSAKFNVSIRTLTISGGKGQLGIGGGVVYDSTSADEYRECLVKAQYYEVLRDPIRLIEALQCVAGEYARLSAHMERLESSARAFHIQFCRERILAKLESVTHDSGPLKVILTLDESGSIEVDATPLVDRDCWTYTLSDRSLSSRDMLLRYKTNRRATYDSEFLRAAEDFGCDEVVFFNERGELCGGSRSNVFLEVAGGLLTPAASCGLLNGCYRQELLASGKCREALLRKRDLEDAQTVYFGSSSHGLVPAVPVTRR